MFPLLLRCIWQITLCNSKSICVEVLWGLLTPVEQRTMWFRPPSNWVTKVVSAEDQSSVQIKGTKPEQRIAANVLGKAPRKQQSCLFVWSRHINWTMERTTTMKRETFICRERPYPALSSSPWEGTLLHACSGCCQGKVHRRSWDFVATLKTVALLCGTQVTCSNRVRSSSCLFHCLMRPWLERKEESPWPLPMDCLDVLLEQFLWCTDPALFPGMRRR